VKEKFWTFNLGHLLTILVWIVSCSVMWGKFTNIVDNHEKQILKIEARLEELNKDVDLVTVEQIRYSGKLIGDATLSTLDVRVYRLEQILPEIRNQISTINVNIDWIKKNLESGEKGAKIPVN
jgi:hypothetical protein